MFKKTTFQFLLFLSITALFYACLTQDYLHSLLIKPNATIYSSNNGPHEIYTGNYPIPTHENLIQWDAGHYKHIAERGYAHNASVNQGDYIFAFFPLYPLLWSLFGANPFVGILLNIALFTLSLLILRSILARFNLQDALKHYLLFPVIICFLLPYTEAIYFLSVCIGLYGLLEHRNKIAFLGFMLAALSRPSYSILLLAFLSSALFFLVFKIQATRLLKDIKAPVLGLLAGTFLVSLYQGFYNDFDWFRFLKVQQYWNTQLQVIEQVSDWSHEGFSMNITIGIVSIALAIVCLAKMLIRLFSRAHLYYSSTLFIWVLSLFYLLGNVAFVLLFNGGNLHSSFRYLAANPFFILALAGSLRFVNFNVFARAGFLFLLVSISFYTRSNLDYTGPWSLSYAGFILVLAASIYFYLNSYFSKVIRQVLFTALFIANAFWTAFLFHLYLLNSWIFI